MQVLNREYLIKQQVPENKGVGRIVAAAHRWPGMSAVQLRETLANARLIAAAPDLLEACEAALWELTFDAPEDWEDEATRILRCAIEQATGEDVSFPDAL